MEEKRKEFSARRNVLESQIAALRSELSSGESEFARLTRQRNERQQRLALDREEMGKMRGVTPANQVGELMRTSQGESKTSQGTGHRDRYKCHARACACMSPGQTPKSLIALKNLKKICEEHLQGRYRLHVIDLVKTPQLAQDDQILAIPTLVRNLPQPIRKIIGDLSDTQRVLVGLDVRPETK